MNIFDCLEFGLCLTVLRLLSSPQTLVKPSHWVYQLLFLPLLGVILRLQILNRGLWLPEQRQAH